MQAILINVTRVSCPVTKSKQKPPVYNIRVNIKYVLFFRLQLCMKSRVRGTLYDLYCLYFSTQAMLKFSNWGHFVICIEMSLHLIMCINISLWLLQDSTIFAVTTNITVCIVWLSGSVQGPSEADLSIVCQWEKMSLSTRSIFLFIKKNLCLQARVDTCDLCCKNYIVNQVHQFILCYDLLVWNSAIWMWSYKKVRKHCINNEFLLMSKIRPLSYGDNIAELNCGEIASHLLVARNSHKCNFFFQDWS